MIMAIQNNYNALIFKIINRFDKQYRKELFNECYIEVHDGLQRYDDSKGSFQSFIYQRLYYTCIDYIKSLRTSDTSLNDMITDEEGDTVEHIDLLQSDLDLDKDIEDTDYLSKHQKTLTPIESFIQQKFYVDGMSVKAIIDIYQPFHLVRSESTIRKILKK